MLDAFYIGLTLALASALFVLGLLFYCLCSHMESPVFRTALRIMTLTYCFFGFVNMVELGSRMFLPDSDDVLLYQVVTLVVAVSQAFLFTYTLILLLNAPRATRKRVVFGFVPMFTLAVVLVVVWLTLPDVWVKRFIYPFIFLYSCLLVYYTWLFVAAYRNGLRKLDNFFSSQEAEHLRWVNFSFYVALGIGVMALTWSLFPSIYMGIVCPIICILFYPYFAIRIIKYGYVYKQLEEVLTDDDIQSCPPQKDTNLLQPPIAKSLESNLKSWLDTKQFLQSGVTLNDVARQIGTNKKYLSIYINQHLNKPFRTWINDLRIEEAKRLMIECPEMNVTEIASRVGFATKSHFGQQFRATTHLSPSNWRQIQ